MEKNEFLHHIGLSVRKYRTLAGLSQEELSGLTECDKNTIGKIERGETDSRLSISRLARESENCPDNSPASILEYDYLRLFDYCHQLSPEQFNNICNTAHIFAKGNKKD